MAVTALAIRIDCPTVSGKHGAFQAAPPCAYFSFAPGWVGVGHTSIIAQVISHPSTAFRCGECWLFGNCDEPRDHGDG